MKFKTCYPSASEIGNTIRKWRQVRSLKQDFLADKLEITRVAMSNIENGKTDITLSRLCSIALALDLTINILISEPEARLL